MREASHEASQFIDQIAGVYKNRFNTVDITGDKFRSEDLFEIVKINEDTIDFKIKLIFMNYHSCFLFGTASYTKDKAFLFKGNKENDCNLKIIFTDKEIKFVDGPDGSKSCRECCCGARAHFYGTSFKRSLCKSIKYMELLKNSQDYQDSIKPTKE